MPNTPTAYQCIGCTVPCEEMLKQRRVDGNTESNLTSLEIVPQTFFPELMCISQETSPIFIAVSM